MIDCPPLRPRVCSAISLCTLLIVLPAGSQGEPQQRRRVLRVFVLAGQSNMEGQGVVDLDHPKYYNGGRGTLDHVIREAKDRRRYAHVKQPNGSYRVRNDVWVRFKKIRGQIQPTLSDCAISVDKLQILWPWRQL